MKIHKQYENFILVNLQIELRNVALLYRVIIFLITFGKLQKMHTRKKSLFYLI